MDRNLVEVLRDEAYAKCRKGDHSWFADKRFDGVAYRSESSYELNDLAISGRRILPKPAIFAAIARVGLLFEPGG